MSKKYKTLDHYKLAYEWLMAIDEGQPVKQLARMLDVEPKTIRNWRYGPRPARFTAREKVPEKPKPIRTDEWMDKAKGFLDDGMSYAEVARSVGVGRDTLRRKFPDKGWTRAQVIDHMISMRKFNEQMRKNW